MGKVFAGSGIFAVIFSCAPSMTAIAGEAPNDGNNNA
jgi:hypothetical protein